MTTQLTPHFSLEELTVTTHREFDNTPTTHEKCVVDGVPTTVNAYENLPRLANFLEQLKALLGGKPIIVLSGFRSRDVNSSCGSKDTSDHRRGCAADIRVPGMTPDQVVKLVRLSGINFDQLIREFDRWTHISVPNTVDTPARRQALIIDRSGTRPYV